MRKTFLHKNLLSRSVLIGLVFLFTTALAATASDPPRFPRVAAEWEPALGALVAWPPMVPEELLVEIAEDDRLFLLVDDDAAQREAEAKLEDLGIDLEVVDFILVGDSSSLSWPRDWGPFALFDGEGMFHLADPRFLDYPSATPACKGRLYSMDILGLDPIDDNATEVVAKTLGFPDLRLPFALTGGNALVDGHGTAFSTCVMLNENRRYLGVSEDEFYRAVEARLGISNYVIVPNFEWFGIQHIDCLLKPLDEETILVKRVPEGHPDHGTIEEIVTYLATLTNPHDRPYRIVRIDTPPYLLGHFVANYTNSLILNEKILVPLFGIPGDEAALQTWRELMPGYEVIGFENPGPWGWSWLDALHCRVRAMWDPEMLYMHHRHLDEHLEAAPSYRVETLIRDHSGAGLLEEELKISWRLRGQNEWQEGVLRAGSNPETFVASISGPESGDTVEYFLSAADQSGRHQTLPRGAPEGFYTFTVAPRSGGTSL